MAIADRHGLAVVEDCAHAHGQRFGDTGAGCFGGLRVVQPPDDQDHARRRGRHAAHPGRGTGPPGPLADRLRAAQGRGRAGVHVWCELPPRGSSTPPSSASRLERFEEQRAERERHARLFETLAAGLTGVGLNPIHPRVTRWGFYRYLFRIDPEQFAGVSNSVIAAALEAEGIAAEVQYPPMNRYDLFQPQLSRMPMCVAPRRPPRLLADELPGGRGGRRAAVRLPQRERVPGRRAGHPAGRRGHRQGAAARRRAGRSRGRG